MKKSRILFSLYVLVAFSLTNAQWVQVGTPSMPQASSITIEGNNLFVGTANNGIFRSTNNGDSWEPVNNGLSMNIIMAMANNSSRLFASTFSDIVTSTDNGGLWSPYYNGLGSGYTAYNFLIESNSIFASGFGVYYSSDNGANWVRQTAGLPSSPVVRAITRKGNKLFAATVDGVYFSEDNSFNWDTAGVGLTKYKVWSIITSGNNLIAGTDTSGIIISTDDGLNWTKVQSDFPKGQVRSLINYENYILAGLGFGWGIYLSSDNGLTWSSVGQGLPALYTYVLSIAGNSTYMFAAGGTTGFFRRPVSELGITGVSVPLLEIPLSFSLSQNYPNPFNPTTTISWQSPVGSWQTLKVYDVLGNEVATLVDEIKPAGSYEIEFNAEELSSGIYFYKLQSGYFVETKKMILLR